MVDDRLAADDYVINRMLLKEADELKSIRGEVRSFYSLLRAWCHSRMSGFLPGKRRSLMSFAARIRSCGVMERCCRISHSSASVNDRALLAMRSIPPRLQEFVRVKRNY